MHRRIQWFPLGAQAIYVLPLLLVAQLAGLMIRIWVGGEWPGWVYFAQSWSAPRSAPRRLAAACAAEAAGRSGRDSSIVTLLVREPRPQARSYRIKRRGRTYVSRDRRVAAPLARARQPMVESGAFCGHREDGLLLIIWRSLPARLRCPFEWFQQA